MGAWWEPTGEWDTVDLDGDGAADYFAADGPDGPIERWDAGGAEMFILAGADGEMAAIGTDENGDGTPEMTMTDPDGDGVLDALSTPWSQA